MINPFQKAKEVIGIHEQVETGAYGGVVPRISPTTVLNNVFNALNMGVPPAIGISTRIAYRPSSGRMLKSADYHTGIMTGTGFVGLKRIAGGIPTAILNVVHLEGNVHPTLSREKRQGADGVRTP